MSDFDAFSPSATPNSQTRSLYETVRQLILADRMEFHTWLPCQVQKVYDDGFVDLLPLLKRVYNGLDPITLPVAQHCMVVVPRGTDYFVKLPVAVGDTGVGLFCERSLDVWGVAGGLVDPLDGRIHDLSDPVFLPGLFPASTPIPGVATTDLVVNNGGTTFTLKKSGKFTLSGAASQELLTIVSDSLTQLISLAASVTPPQPSIAAALTAIQVRLTLIKG